MCVDQACLAVTLPHRAFQNILDFSRWSYEHSRQVCSCHYPVDELPSLISHSLPFSVFKLNSNGRTPQDFDQAILESIV